MHRGPDLTDPASTVLGWPGSTATCAGGRDLNRRQAGSAGQPLGRAEGVWGDPGHQIKSELTVYGLLLPPAMGNRGETQGRIWEAGLLT
jgi:hypothetical protein